MMIGIFKYPVRCCDQQQIPPVLRCNHYILAGPRFCDPPISLSPSATDKPCLAPAQKVNCNLLLEGTIPMCAVGSGLQVSPMPCGIMRGRGCCDHNIVCVPATHQATGVNLGTLPPEPPQSVVSKPNGGVALVQKTSTVPGWVLLAGAAVLIFLLVKS